MPIDHLWACPCQDGGGSSPRVVTCRRYHHKRFTVAPISRKVSCVPKRSKATASDALCTNRMRVEEAPMSCISCPSFCHMIRARIKGRCSGAKFCVDAQILRGAKLLRAASMSLVFLFRVQRILSLRYILEKEAEIKVRVVGNFWRRARGSCVAKLRASDADVIAKRIAVSLAIPPSGRAPASVGSLQMSFPVDIL